MVFSPDKRYYLALGFNELFPHFSLNDITTENVIMEKIVGIVVKNKLDFKPHLKNIYIKG